MDATTRLLVEFALDTSYEALSGGTVHECKRRLVDTLGCAIGAYDEPLVVSMRDLASTYQSALSASLWGSSRLTTPEMAAFANGVMLRVLDLSDTYLASGGAHPSDIVSGLVAAAESSHASGRALIAATVVGYEIYCRMIEIVDLGAKGWDQPVPSVLATAVGAGLLMGLNQAQLGHAISLALIPNLALRQTRHGELSHWKGCAGANASRNAVFAALLAKHGVEGPSDAFEGKQGLWSITGKFAWPDKPVLQQTQMISSTHLKSLALCYHDQSAALCALQIHPQLGGREVRDIQCVSYRAAVEMTGADPTRWAPSTRETADHSMPFIVATTLAHGKVDSHSFAPERLNEPRVTQLMKRVKVTEDLAYSALWPSAAPARLTVRTVSGETYAAEVLYPKGHLRDPMSDEAVNAKFIGMLGQRAGADGGRRMLDTLWHVDDAKDVAATLRGLFQEGKMV